VSASVVRLRRVAPGYRDPFEELDFGSADPTRAWLPHELLSLACLPEHASMTEPERIRSSQVDFARLCAAGLWLEGLLMSRVTARGCIGVAPDEARIMLREVREEAGHGLMFLEMIERAKLPGVALLGPTRLLSWVARRLNADDAEFWAMVYIGESITNNFVARALRRARANERICPLAWQVMALHHRDEAHHIAAARALLESRIAGMSVLRRQVFGATFDVLLRCFLEATLYPTEASLAAVGIAQPRRVARAVRASPARRALADACAQPALRLIGRLGLIRDRG
jgi:hypothetical protein